MESHVTSLELSKKLKELGLPQKSELYWWTNTFGIKARSSGKLVNHKPHNPQGGWTYYSAFLASELGEILPYIFLLNQIIQKEDGYG